MITTSSPYSTSLRALSMVTSAMAVCSSAGLSKVEAATSPLISHLFISVTSSGLSSTSNTINLTSGLFVSIDLAICFIIVVFPAFGGETISPLCPLPIGDNRSTMRAVMLDGSAANSRFNLSSGKSGVRSSK